MGNIPVATLRPHTGGGVDIYYVHTDQLNTPRAVTRPIDNVLMWSWFSDRFGTNAANENPTGFKYNLRFAGAFRSRSVDSSFGNNSVFHVCLVDECRVLFVKSLARRRVESLLFYLRVHSQGAADLSGQCLLSPCPSSASADRIGGSQSFARELFCQSP